MKKLITLLILFWHFFSCGQIKNESNTYINKTYGYEVKKPSWLTLKEENDKIWGGILPKIEDIENAVLIVGYLKNEFDSFEDFERIHITGNKFGQETLYNKQHIWYGYNDYDIKKIENGISSKVFTFYKNRIYHNQFVLIETSKAYLFIQFCATPETYNTNIILFDQLLEGLTVK